jgi:hypothetical protein
MSFFIISMPEEGFRSSPPVSKQTPLPMRASFGPLVPQRMSIRRGAFAAARPTAWMVG